MSKTQFLAAAAACLAMVSVAAAPAMSQTQPAPRPNVALLDVNYVFKNHAGFKAKMEAMKAEVERAESQLKTHGERIQAAQETLKQFKPGSPEYKAKEEAIAHDMADLKIQAQAQRKEFLLKEASIYHEVYQEIQQVVAYYATQNGIAAVVKFNGEAVKPEEPDDVLRYINQDVVWFNQGLNITTWVLDTMNARAGATVSRTNAPPAGNPAPRTGVPYRQ